MYFHTFPKEKDYLRVCKATYSEYSKYEYNFKYLSNNNLKSRVRHILAQYAVISDFKSTNGWKNYFHRFCIHNTVSQSHT